MLRETHRVSLESLSNLTPPENRPTPIFPTTHTSHIREHPIPRGRMKLPLAGPELAMNQSCPVEKRASVPKLDKVVAIQCFDCTKIIIGISHFLMQPFDVAINRAIIHINLVHAEPLS